MCKSKTVKLMQVKTDSKVLAGVVMTRGIPFLENGTVVAVTTGTKCIEGDYMSDKGISVNDCHAEILATRCLRDYLYSQIEHTVYAMTEEEKEESIFQALKEGDEEGLLELKPDIKFHLYISTSPCGNI